MKKRRERSWMYDRVVGRSLKPEFVNGVQEFIEHVKQQRDYKRSGTVRCPCLKCKNMCYLDVETIREHLYKEGFCDHYHVWLCHGETIPRSRRRWTGGSVLCYSSQNNVVHNKTQHVEEEPNDEAKKFFNLRKDAEKPLYEGSKMSQMASWKKVVRNKTQHVEEEPNDEAKMFFKLLKDAEKPLYEGSKMSLLEMASRTASLKCEYNLSQSCVDGFASLMNEVNPESSLLSKSLYDTKKVLKGLQLPHEKIHTCPNGCMLFWKANAHLDKCSVCGKDRYKRTSRGKVVPVKVLIYFPITPRLQRLFATKNTAEHMTWHRKTCRVRGTMAHPSDGEAWKHFDTTYADFAAEPRNVRLGLCTDEFTPYTRSGGKYSCWPIILTPYNLPPLMCMEKPYMFLSLIVPGPKNPKENMDIYMQPLIDELKQLWETGALTYDISKKQNFNLRAAVLWTTSDFLAYDMLSGWSTSGNKPCPYCMDKGKCFWLKHSGKVSWFDCHRQFLQHDHPFRKNKISFYKNRVEDGVPPPRLSGQEGWDRVSSLPKSKEGPASLKCLKKEKRGWNRQSIFWELPYWKNLLIRHNLDVMNIENNFFYQLINTIMDVKGQTSDNINARKDLKLYCRRRELELLGETTGVHSMPRAPFALDKAQRKVLCEWVRNLKFPDGFASNLSRCVDLRACKFSRLKSYDCHVFMNRLLPVALKELLPLHVWEAVTELSQFFRDLSSSTIQVKDMDRLEKNIPEILCKLEKIFLPSFFNTVEHLPIHLPYEAKVGGPVQYRWMYPFKRFLNHLKRKIGSKARVEVAICNAYLTEETANFFSNYFQLEVDTKDGELGQNVTSSAANQSDPDVPELFRLNVGHAPSEGCLRFLQDKEYDRAHLCVLANCGILNDYERKFKEHIIQINPSICLQDVWTRYEHQFLDWFKTHVLRSLTSNDVVRALAMGPSRQVRTWNQYDVNGFNFHTFEYSQHESSKNYGVWVKNHEGLYKFGILEDVIELVYLGDLGVYKTVLFKCDWMDLFNGMNIHKQYKLVEVNHSKKFPKYDPFVLPHQVHQVYYAPYPSLKLDRIQWWAVFKTKARSAIDDPIDINFFQEEFITDPPTLCAPEDGLDYQLVDSEDCDEAGDEDVGEEQEEDVEEEEEEEEDEEDYNNGDFYDDDYDEDDEDQDDFGVI